MIVTVSGAKNGTPKPWWPFRGRSMRVRVRFRMDAPYGSTIKLFGLADLSALWRFGRVRKGGWRHLLDFGHETSDRVVAVWVKDGVRLVAYPYRDGSGPATDGVSYSKTICTVGVSGDDPAWTEWRTVHIDIDGRNTLYCVSEPGDEWAYNDILPCRLRRTPVQVLCWSHGRNGDGGLKQDVTYEIEVL